MATSGILLIDKGAGYTSHDAVSRTRKLLDTRKIGHAGTLDPMATGLLVLGANNATRLLTYLVGLDKEYTTVIRLGASTVTDDREGEVLTVAEPAAVRAITEDQIRAEAAGLTGNIEQSPSSVSAIKVAGRRAYDLVRSGEEVALPKRPVTIFEFELDAPVWQTLEDGSEVIDIPARIVCSSGTYIRALARDMGAALGVGGHLTALRRTRVGPFRVDAARSIESLRGEDADAHEALLSSEQVATTLFPSVHLSEQQTRDLSQGKRVLVPECADAKIAAALAPSGRLIGLVRVKRGEARVAMNFPTNTGVAT